MTIINKIKTSSINEILARLLKNNNQQLKIVKSFVDSITSENNIFLTLEDENGNEKVYTIPSYKKLLTQNSSTNISGTTSSLYLPSFLGMSSTPILDKNVIEIDNSSNIKKLSDKIFKYPLDFTSAISVNAKQIYCSTIIIDYNKNLTNLKNISDITGNYLNNYDDFKTKLIEKTILFSEEHNIYNFDLDILEKEGYFIVTESTSDGKNTNLILSNNTYKYYTSESKYIEKKLAAGDELLLNNTKFTISEINIVDGIEKYKVNLKQSLPKGTIIYLNSSKISNKKIYREISKKELHINFFKLIDENNNLKSRIYSSGFLVDSNKLKINNNDLNDYISENVYEFDEYLEALKSEDYLFVKEQVTLNSPTLIKNNFKIFQINDHIINLPSELNELWEQYRIAAGETEIVSTKLNELSSIDPLYVETEMLLAGLFLHKNNIIRQIKNYTEYKKFFTRNITPKYSVIGFWEMPEIIKDSNNYEHSVIQFKIRYRYLKDDNIGFAPKINFTATDGTIITASFYDWNEFYTPVRIKKINPTTGKYEWIIEDVTDSNNNINSLKLAITPGETIEFQIKSVGENGFPENPEYSNWSSSIKINFDNYQELLEKNKYLNEFLNNLLLENNLSILLNSLTTKITAIEQNYLKQISQTIFQETTIANIKNSTENKIKFTNVSSNLKSSNIIVFNLALGVALTPGDDYLISVDTNNLPNSYIQFMDAYLLSFGINDNSIIKIMYKI